MRTLGRPELATLVLAVIRGLLQDLDATGDTARTDRAFEDFLALIDAPHQDTVDVAIAGPAPTTLKDPDRRRTR
jgi:hypothetical protein